MKNTPICHEDGTLMARDVRPVPFLYKGETVLVEMPGWYCPKCGEGLHTREDAKASDRAINTLKAKIEGFLSAEDIKRIRKKLKLTQHEAGNLIGGGPKAFTKYEKGDALPSRAIVSALRLLDNYPEGLEILRQGLKEKGSEARRERAGV